MFKRFIVFLTAAAVFSGLACNLATLLPNGEQQAKTGDVLFEDDFSDPTSGWDAWVSDGATVSYQDGGLRMLIQQPRYDYWSRPGKRFDNIRISVDATRLAGPLDNDYGILCRYIDQNNFYALIISSDGYAGVMKVKDGTYSVISADAMTFVQAIKTGDASNQLEANCSGQSLSLSVNGQAAVQASDSDFTSGEVGLITGSYDEPGVDILFDNFSVHKE